jgi:small subunit ribosomal protein S20
VAVHRSALKRARQSKKRRERNLAVKSKIKTLEKRALQEKDKGKAEEALKRFHSVLDKAVKKRIIHKNTAARKKSRVTKRINALP